MLGYKNIRQLHEILLIHRLFAYVVVLKYFIQTKDSLNNITAYTYDQAGSLITLTDAKANATQFTYDLIGRLTQQTDPMAKQTIYTYDSQGNLTSKTDPNGNTIQYTYDALNRLVQKTYPDASTTTYQYDAIGNLTSASNAYISYSFAYDALGRMTSVTDSLGKTISYVYDANSNRTSMTSPIGTTSYTYNALNQLTQLVQGTKTFGFVYDSLGRRTSLSMPNGTTTSYSYDSLSRLTNLSTLNSQLQSINSNIYTYDSVGNKLTKQDTTGIHNYSYDNTYQLTQATHPTIPTEAFAYDAVGNRNNTTVDAANKLLQDPNATYQYDANGNRYVKTQTDGTIVYYSYDYEGRLTRVETQKPGLTSIAVYKYDPLGRRIEKNVDGVVTRYLYDGMNVIAEMDGNNNITKMYTHNLAIDDPLAVTTNGQTYYYHKDALGTIISLTDSTGTIVQKYEYDSFGNITLVQNPAFKQPYAYTGREWDEETEMYYYRARYYDPKAGKFLTLDPISFAAGDTNLYRYVFNSPVNYIDSLGLKVKIVITRDTSNNNSVSGTIDVSSDIIKDAFSGYTLEPIRTKGLVPTGTYNAFMRNDHSPQRIELKGVPGNTNIQIHSGNYPSDSKGCFLTGKNRKADYVGDSRNAVNEILNIIGQDASGDIEVKVTQTFSLWLKSFFKNLLKSK